MGKRAKFNRKSDFWGNLGLNKISYLDYFERLVELSLSVFEWKNLPDTVDVRFLEMGLFRDGKMLFFKDEVTNEFYCMRTMIGGTMSNYNIPNQRTAYAPNGYQNKLDEKNSVIIFNNLTHTPSVLWCLDYARRLQNIDRTIDVNVNAQKTPVLILCNENQEYTMKQVYSKYEGNEPVIFGNDKFNDDNVTTLSTQAPFLCDRLYELKTSLWNEALTYIGIPNVTEEKKERLIVDEVKRSQGGAIASRFAKLGARQQACDEINRMFGLNISVDYRDVYKITDEEKPNESEVVIDE